MDGVLFLHPLPTVPPSQSVTCPLESPVTKVRCVCINQHDILPLFPFKESKTCARDSDLDEWPDVTTACPDQHKATSKRWQLPNSVFKMRVEWWIMMTRIQSHSNRGDCPMAKKKSKKKPISSVGVKVLHPPNTYF